ncbi:hypothetical protein [Anaerostipes sp.]|uniref:hypothetical protein n=1 Tax=Anaerostipes sp. TaxID=1872530 RepID=UPI0025BD2CB4|nr:hypothetical protein [Anaerostipes sp.]MBS7007935.1 hypothetical protein [Anaerostipes sp.]
MGHKEEVYSYHTFYFPFIWEGTEERKVQQEDIISYFDSSNYWDKTDIKDFSNVNTTAVLQDEQSRMWLYQTYQYFHTPVCQAVFGNDSDVVHNYQFCTKEVREQACYTIKKAVERDKKILEKEYKLDLYSIKLKIFNTGIGILIFECENRKYCSVEAVKDINEYGRRITAPFLDSELCADFLSVSIGNIGTFSFDLKEKFGKTHTILHEQKYANYNCIASFILDILNYKMPEKKFTDNKSESSTKWYLATALDDRMYVTCLVRDDYFAKCLQKENVCGSDNEGTYPKGCDQFRQNLYELIFVDCHNQISCPTERMRDEILKKQLYDRWLSYGTAYGVTHHSFFCLTTSDHKIDRSVINPFLIIYTEMVTLCLAQRSSIISFQRKIASFTNELKRHKFILHFKATRKLTNLQEDYIAFQNQLQFFEVTSQEQGIELYDMIAEALYIDKEKQMLMDQMNIAYEAASINQGFRWNSWALIISILALAVSLGPHIPDILIMIKKALRFILYELYLMRRG